MWRIGDERARYGYFISSLTHIQSDIPLLCLLTKDLSPRNCLVHKRRISSHAKIVTERRLFFWCHLQVIKGSKLPIRKTPDKQCLDSFDPMVSRHIKEDNRLLHMQGCFDHTEETKIVLDALELLSLKWKSKLLLESAIKYLNSGFCGPRWTRKFGEIRNQLHRSWPMMKGMVDLSVMSVLNMLASQSWIYKTWRPR